MSAESPSVPQPAARRKTSETVAGYLAAMAAFTSLVGIAWHPLRLILPSLVVSLVAAGMVGAGKRLQLVCTLICAASLFLGMTVAVITSHPLF